MIGQSCFFGGLWVYIFENPWPVACTSLYVVSVCSFGIYLCVYNFSIWFLLMFSVYGFSIWLQCTVSVHWVLDMVSLYGFNVRFKYMVSKYGSSVLSALVA